MAKLALSILLIEDNPGDASLVKEILKDEPGFFFNIQHADRLSKGLAQLGKEAFDVVLLDLNLPDSNGYETFQSLHRKFPDIPTVLLTGLADDELGLRAVRDGAQDYLAKWNLVGSALARSIRYAMERKQAAIALNKSEHLFKKTFSCLADAIFIVEAQTRQIMNCNPAAASIFGFNENEMIGKNALFLLDTRTRQDAKDGRSIDFHSFRSGVTYERVMQRKNGETFFAEFSFEPLEDKPTPTENWVVLLRDISLRKQAEETLRESEERYFLAARGANDGLWDWHIKKDEVYYSPRWKAMLGYADHEVESSPNEWINRIHPDERDGVIYAMTNHINNKTPHFQSEHRILHRDGTYRWMLVRGMAVRDADGIAYRMAGSQTDITARKNAEEQLIHDAFHDLLTGLPNRALFLDRLDRTIEYNRRYEHFAFAVLFLDLDRFKVINDSLGHAVGDQLLIEISKVLKTCMRSSDTVARFGGDEFVVLLNDIHDMQDAVRVVNHIQEVLAKPFRVGNNRVFTSASIGIVLSNGSYLSKEEIMRDADIAMYEAKMLGKANYIIFNTEMRKQAINRLSMENDLHHALTRGEFRLYYQPIVSLKENSLAGFEALLRWQHPKKGNIPPEEFIPVAEETGLILDIGHWLLQHACSHVKKWQGQFPRYQDLFVNINISRKQFNQMEFVENLRKVLRDTWLNPSCVNLEITENVLMENAESMIEILNKIRGLGVGLHVDDFGKGYSSLSYLQQFPIDTLKIDYSFINRIGTNGDRAEIVKTILVLARELGVDSIAEGIETENQMIQLRDLDCHYGQGFYFGKPMNPDRVPAFLKKHPRGNQPVELVPLIELSELNVAEIGD